MLQARSLAWLCQRKVISGMDNRDDFEDGTGRTASPSVLEFKRTAGVIQCVQKRSLVIYSPTHTHTYRKFSLDYDV